MIKLVRVAILGSLLWCSSTGCGDGPTSRSRDVSPTVALARSFPPGTTFTVVSGETGVPIAGARFVVGGEDIASNDAGEVTIHREAPFYSPVDIVAAGYLDRNTTFKMNELRYTLWPKMSPNGLTEHNTAEIVYTTSNLGAEPIFGQEPLRRWISTLSQIDVILGEGFDSADERQINTQIEAVAEFNGVLPDDVSYSPPRFGALPVHGYVELRIMPDYSSCVEYNSAAVATVGRGEYTSSRITYCSESAAGRKTIVLHELGHTAGLRHSSSENDIMRAPPRASSFHPREGLLLLLIYQRNGGNLFPDTDRGSDRQSLGGSIELVCGTRVESVAY